MSVRSVILSANLAMTSMIIMGQSATPPKYANPELIQLLKAHSSQNVILANIRENKGKWDTSERSLAALRNAGATDVELKEIVRVSPTRATTVFGAHRSSSPNASKPRNEAGVAPHKDPCAEVKEAEHSITLMRDIWSDEALHDTHIFQNLSEKQQEARDKGYNCPITIPL